MINPGVLYVVATPIGNLKDITLRAIEMLKACDRILVEDTRQSQKLLQEYGIVKPMLTIHEHNEKKEIEKIYRLLCSGESLCLISDAGTPLISDPGFHLVRTLKDQGIIVVPIPGACALISALSVSGLATDAFVFLGFLPSKTTQRQEKLKALMEEKKTLIFYESPHRIIDSIMDMAHVLGGHRKATIARELTKHFETIRQDTLENLIEWIKCDKEQTLGEFVVCVEGLQISLDESEALSLDEQYWLDELKSHVPPSALAQILARYFDKNKKRYYSKLITEK